MASKGMAWLKDCEMWLEAKPLCSQDSTRWHDLRSQGITASEIATLFGLNPFEQPLELFKRKRAAVAPAWNEKKPEPPNEADDPLHLKLGRMLEPLVMDEYEKRNGPLIHRGGYLFRHKAYKFLLATPDAIAGFKVLLECKTAARWTEQKWGDETTDQIPPAYMCQVQHQMGVMGADKCWVAVFFRHSDEFRFYEIQRSQKLIDRLFAAAHMFWQQVLANTPPDIDWMHGSTPQVVRELSAPVKKELVALGPGWEQEWDEYQALGKVESAVKKRREFLKLRVQHAIGEAAGGLLSDGRKVWKKEVERSGFTVAPTKYISLWQSDDATDFPLIGEVPYVAIDQAKQPARLGFTEPDQVRVVQEPVRDGAAEAPDGGAVHADRPDVPHQDTQAGGMHAAVGDAMPAEPVADGAGAGWPECSPDPVRESEGGDH